MTLSDAQSLFVNKFLEIGGDTYSFDNRGNYILRKGADSIEGTYSMIERENEFYFVTNPPILENKPDLLISIILGDGDQGIRLSN